MADHALTTVMIEGFDDPRRPLRIDSVAVDPERAKLMTQLSLTFASQIATTADLRLIPYAKVCCGKPRKVKIKGAEDIAVSVVSAKQVALSYDLYVASTEYMVQEDPTFVVLNDWNELLGGMVKNVKFNEIRLPFPTCYFCFDYKGKSVLIQAKQQKDEEVRYTKLLNVVADKYTRRDDGRPINDPIYKDMVYAACIAMETELATKPSEEERVLLKKDRTKSQYMDRQRGGGDDVYRILTMKKGMKYKLTSEGIETQEGSGPKVRLHFRRGHWRHYKATGKDLWINWMLVGSAELGTVHKTYVL